MLISLYSHAKDNTSTATISIPDFLSGIKYGKWKDQIEPIRVEPDKAKRTELKLHLPCITTSGAFATRKESAIITHSGFICIDVDGYTDKTALLTDPYTYALFRSCSGNGLAALIKIDQKKHKDSFRWIQSYYFNTYGIIIDPAPQNPASLRYVSYDPDLYVNEKSKVSRTLIEKVSKPKSLPVVIGDDAVSGLIAEACRLNIDMAPDYKSYVDLAFAISNGFGENGRPWFHSLCSINSKYNSKHTDTQYDISLKRNNTGITVGTLYWMLKQAGINIPSETNKAVQIASIGKKSGRTKEGIAAQLVQVQGVSPDVAAHLVNEVFNRPDITLASATGDPERLIESLLEWISQNHPVRKNVITQAVEDRGADLNKERLNSIYLRARGAFNISEVTYDLMERIIFSEFTPTFNPITDYIDRNRHRNTAGNIELLISCIKTDTPHAARFLTKWCLGIIAAYSGLPVRYVLILCGGQYSGKTQFFRRLLPKELHKYYAESSLDKGKDDELLMCQKLMVMDDEFGGKSKQDEKYFKRLTSADTFSLRAPYGRQNEDFKRLAILCGTANDTQIINDRTGNTRILTIEVESIDHELYNSINKDELFMELVRLYESGYEWELTKDELHDLGIISKQFEDINTERELILQFFTTPDQVGFVEHLTATEIKDWIESHCRQQVRGFKSFGIELKKIFGNARQSKEFTGKRYPLIKLMQNQPTQTTQF